MSEGHEGVQKHQYNNTEVFNDSSSLQLLHHGVSILDLFTYATLQIYIL